MTTWAMCKKPITLKDHQKVKCGRCIECLIQRSKEWATRLDIESKHAKSGVFLTLTYSDDNVTWHVDQETGEMVTSLEKRDLQLFIKRLRKRQLKYKNPDQVRYFACGEYGGKTKRAHFHALVFNLDRKVINEMDTLWTDGFIKVGDVTPKSIRYVSNYMLLKDNNKLKIQAEPFTTMSKKPVIGHQYFTTRSFEQHEIHEKDEMLVAGKYKPQLPNHFLDKITTKETKHKIKKARIEKFAEKREELLKEAERSNPLDPLGEAEKRKQDQVKIKERKFNKYRKQNKL